MTQGQIEHRSDSRSLIAASVNPVYLSPPAPATQGSNLVVWEMALKVLRRWWRVAIPFGCLLAMVSMSVLVYRFTPAYRAISWIRIEPENSLFPNTRFSVAQTQLQLIRTPMVLEDAVRDSKVARLVDVRNSDDPVQWLASRVGVSPVGDSNVFNISFTTSESQAAADVANAITLAYFKLYQQESESKEKQLLETLEQERERVKRDAILQRNKIRDISGSDSEVDTAGNVSPKNLVAVLQEQIVRRQVALEMAKAELKVSEALDAQQQVTVTEELLQEEVSRNPLAAKTVRDRAKLQAIQQTSRLGEQDPHYKELAEQIREDETQLDEFKKTLPDELEQVIVANRKMSLQSLRENLESEKFALDILKREFQTQLRGLLGSNMEGIELEMQRAELRWQEQMMTLVGEEIFQRRANLRFAPGSMSVLREAKPPAEPVADLPYKTLAMAAGGSFLLPFLLAFLWEQLLRRVSTSQELAKQSSLPVLGEISTLPPLGRAGQRRRTSDLDLFRESIDILSTSIVLYEPLRDMRVLAVTSAVNGEGKTSISSQVAVSLARSTHQPTLLIDADLRRPDIQSIFAIRQEPGLVDVLEHRCRIDDAIVSDVKQDLHVLPAGRLHCSPQKLVGNGDLGALIAELKQRYRYIVIDTPPVLSVAETMVYARHSDAVLLCTMRDVSRMDQVRAACSRLEAAGRRPVGTVLSGVPANSYRSSYGHYDYSVNAGSDAILRDIRATNGSEPTLTER